jgi:type IV pilus assembly protein PilW
LNNKRLKAQTGLSLIELMIAITLGILLTSAMISLFINSKKSYRINENMSRLQENAKFAMTFISRDIRMADYRACETSDRLDTAIAGQSNTGLNGSDSITLLWQPYDCDDVSVAESTSTVYTIENGDGNNPALFRSINGNSKEMVEGIENLQILYGEEIDANYVPNYYVNSASVAAMSQVISVRVTLTARTLDDNIALDGGRVTRNLTSTIALRNRLP